MARHAGAAGRLAVVFMGVVTLAACHDNAPTAPAAPAANTPQLTCSSNGGVVQLATLHAATLDCSSASTVSLEGGGASYLVVPQFAVSGVPNQPITYVIGAQNGASVAASVRGARAATSIAPTAAAVAGPWFRPEPGPSSRQARFDRALRVAERRAVTSGRWSRPAPGSPIRLSVRGAVSPPPLSSVRDFQVLSSNDSVNPTFATVAARLVFAGPNVLVYVDTLAPAGGFTPDQLTAFGTLFDQTLYPIDLNAFGPPTDIDQNGRVIMLLSPVVNALTPRSQCDSQGFIAGFFDGIDFDASSPNSNHGEIFYGIVPDPSGVASCPHSVTELDRTVPATFLHELQHLVSFGQHVVVHRGEPEEGWLDEGLSIVAEELGSVHYEQRYPPPAGRTNTSQLFPDSSQGFIVDALTDSYGYLLRPDTATATLHSDADGGFAWRGADWLLMRWLGDHEPSDFYRRLDQGSVTGVPNIENAAGEPFPALFGDFGMSLWTDSLLDQPRSSIPSRNRFTTRTLRTLYQALFNAAGPSASVPSPYPLVPSPLTIGGAVNASMPPGTVAFYRLDTPAAASTVRVLFSTPGGSPFAANLHPQLSIFRLPQ